MAWALLLVAGEVAGAREDDMAGVAGDGTGVVAEEEGAVSALADAAQLDDSRCIHALSSLSRSIGGVPESPPVPLTPLPPDGADAAVCDGGVCGDVRAVVAAVSVVVNNPASSKVPCAAAAAEKGAGVIPAIV